jgi:CRISPR/Cas system-associated exonuclease Cas4 (RecB family)
MTYFLQDIANYIFKRLEGNFRDLIIVFPNRRAKLFFNSYLSQITHKPTWAPVYYTISEFIQKIGGMQLADPLTLIFHLFRVYKQVTGSNETFDTFYYYCEMILSDFDDIDKYLVDPKMLYSNLSDIKTLEDFSGYFSEDQIKAVRQFWESFTLEKPSEEQEKFISIWDALYHIYIEYNALLDEQGIGYEGKAYQKVVKIIKGSGEMPFLDKKIAFIGFNALNRSEEILFDQFRNYGNAWFFWDFHTSYIDSDIHEAGYFIRNYLKRYPQPSDFTARVLVQDLTPRIRTLAVPSNISQAKILPMCLEMLESNSVIHPEMLAIVLADETLLLPVVNSLPGSISKVNVSMGYPVTDTPVYAFLVSLIDLQSNRKNSVEGNPTLFYHRDYFALMNHPFLSALHEKINFKQFQEECRQKNQVYIDPDSGGIEDTLYQSIFTSVKEPEKLGTYLSGILESIALILADSADKDDKELKWQLEVIFSVHKVLTRFAEQITVSGIQLSFRTVLNLIRRILAAISVPFSGEPLSGLQIMGILETRTLDFEKLVILSMNEGKFPKSGHLPSLIPYSLREGFGLPTIRHQDAIFAYYFYRLLHRTKDIILVFNTKSEGLQKGEPSRFIYQLLYNSDYQIDQLSAAYSVNTSGAYSIRARQKTEVRNKLKKYLRPEGNSYLSPSALNIYLNCKLRFYFRYVEELDEKEDISEEIEASVFGSILHGAMKKLYSEYTGTTVHAAQLEELGKNNVKIEQALKSAFEDEFFRKSNVSEREYRGRLLIVKDVIKKYIRGIIDYDVRNSPFKMVSLEQHHHIEIPLPKRNNRVAVGGIIDRIDEKQGITRIIDYKTGQKNNSFRTVTELFSAQPAQRNSAVFQTFLYAWIMEKELIPAKNIQPGLFFVRNIYDKNFDYRIHKLENRQRSVVENFEPLFEEFDNELRKLVAQIFDEENIFSQTEDTQYCAYCPYNEICMRKI